MFGGGKIESISAREILDSRGQPTVACRVTLRSGVSVEAKVPSGASTGAHEALELRDGGKRYGGKGVLKAVANVNQKIAPVMRGIEAARQQDIDHVMLEMDGTAHKSKLGANAILGVSLACAQATAVHRGLPLWKSLRQTFSFPRPARLPFATMNVLNGGVHAAWASDVQECMIVPKQRTFAERLRAGSEIFQALRKLLSAANFVTTVGDEGGFAPRLGRPEETFSVLIRAIKNAGYKPGQEIGLALDVASSEFYQKSDRRYHLKTEGVLYAADTLLARYRGWLDDFPFVSIEDPFAEDDWAAWTEAFPIFKKHGVRVVGDDLLVTDVKRLKKAIDTRAADAILIKPNQIGTLTETVAAIVTAQAAGWATSISHRSGETSDTTIADLAVAAGSDFIKTGSLSRSERIEKYNRLLAIEGEMKEGID